MRTGRTRAWTRGAASPLLAMLVHVLAFVAVANHPLHRTLPTPPSVNEQCEIELEISEENPVLTEPAAPSGSSASATSQPSSAAPRTTRDDGTRVTASGLIPPVARPAQTEGPPSSAEDQQGESPGPVALVAPRAPDIGIGGPNPFLPRSAAAVEQAEAKRTVDQALRDAGREKDRVLGLGPEGPVLTALADGTARSVAPVRGRAVFIATSNAAGEVVALELQDAEGGRPGWADAARIALANLRGKKLRVAPGTTRAVMKIEVVSAWKLPSGQDPGSDVSLFRIPLSKGEGKDSAKVSILDPIPKVSVDYLELGPGVKIPIVSIQLDIFRATTDPSNLGAKPRRVIHSRLLDSTVM